MVINPKQALKLLLYFDVHLLNIPLFKSAHNLIGFKRVLTTQQSFFSNEELFEIFLLAIFIQNVLILEIFFWEHES